VASNNGIEIESDPQILGIEPEIRRNCAGRRGIEFSEEHSGTVEIAEEFWTFWTRWGWLHSGVSSSGLNLSTRARDPIKKYSPLLIIL
jgi:hypothetical protein